MNCRGLSPRGSRRKKREPPQQLLRVEKRACRGLYHWGRHGCQCRPPHSAECEIVAEAAQILAAFIRAGAQGSHRGLLITPKGRARHKLVETRLRLKRLSADEIEAYLGSGELARQGRRLCAPGSCRRFRPKTCRILFRGRRSAALRDHVSAFRRRLFRPMFPGEQGVTSSFSHRPNP